MDFTKTLITDALFQSIEFITSDGCPYRKDIDYYLHVNTSSIPMKKPKICYLLIILTFPIEGLKCPFFLGGSWSRFNGPYTSYNKIIPFTLSWDKFKLTKEIFHIWHFKIRYTLKSRWKTDKSYQGVN